MTAADSPGAPDAVMEPGDADADWLVLDPGETVLWSASPRVLSILPAVAVGLLLAAVGVGAAVAVPEPIAALLVPFGVAVPVWQYLVVRNTRFVVTDRAVAVKKGVLGRSVVRVGLDRVQNSTYRQHALGAAFGYGAVGIESADGRTVTFHDIEDPREVRALVDERSGQTDAIPGTVEQWEAVLREVRALRGALESEPAHGSDAR